MNEYNSIENYTAMFADILADVGCGDKEKDAETAQNVLEAFELAICDWLNYHEDCAAQYRNLHAKFIEMSQPSTVDDTTDSCEIL